MIEWMDNSWPENFKPILIGEKKFFKIDRLRAVSLFSVVRRAKREKRKWPRAWLMARDGRGTKKERLPAKPERMVFHGLVIFWRQN